LASHLTNMISRLSSLTYTRLLRCANTKAGTKVSILAIQKPILRGIYGSASQLSEHAKAGSVSGSVSAPFLVVGLGLGGLSVSHWLCQKLNKKNPEHKLYMMEPSGKHYQDSAFSLAATGAVALRDVESPLADHLPRAHNVYWVQERAVSFDPKNNCVISDTGVAYYYNVLVIATGLIPDLDQIKGLKDALGKDQVSTSHIFPLPNRTRDFTKYYSGGNAVFADCGGAQTNPATQQSIMFTSEEYWRRHVGHWNVNIHFNTADSALFPVPKYNQALVSYSEKNGIENLNYRTVLKEVRPLSKEAIFETGTGQQVVQPYDFLHVAPPMTPRQEIANSDLADSNGFVEVDEETLQHIRYPNVFALGSCTNIPSRSAFATVQQSLILRANLLAHLNNKPFQDSYNGYTAVPISLGYNRGMLCEYTNSNGSYQIAESFPFDQSQKSSALHLYISNRLSPDYWAKMIRGLWIGSQNSLTKCLRLLTVADHQHLS